MKNIINYIKALFGIREEEPQPEWLIHWYSHVVFFGEGITYVKCDHTSIVEYWEVGRIIPRLGEVVTYIPSNDTLWKEHEKRYVNMPPIMRGTVIEVRHNSTSGGEIVVYDKNNILINANSAPKNTAIGNVIDDEAFAQIQEERSEIMMGNPIPLSGFGITL